MRWLPFLARMALRAGNHSKYQDHRGLPSDRSGLTMFRDRSCRPDGGVTVLPSGDLGQDLDPTDSVGWHRCVGRRTGAVSTLRLQTGQAILRVEFTSPSPLGNLGSGSP